MCVKQAIYTSVRTSRNEGYQLAARSPGITEQEAKELAQWGPGHDSMYSDSSATASVNFHQMQSGAYCISRTVLAGREYSGRGGRRSYTHMCLVPGHKLRRFANNPFSIMDAIIAAGRFQVAEKVPAELEPVNLIGRASLVNKTNLREVVRQTGPHKLAVLINAALNTQRLGIVPGISGKKLFSTLLDLLPLPLRSTFPLTTGLRSSATRDYRLMVLPPVPEEQRRAIRQVHLEVLDLTQDLPAKFAPRDGWPELMHHLLRTGQLENIAEVIHATSEGAQEDTALLAEQQRQQLDEKDAQATRSLLPS